MIEALQQALGNKAVLTGDDCAPWAQDWTGQYTWTPLCVVRPENTDQVSTVMRLCHRARIPVVPVCGHTGLAGGTKGEGAVMLSLDRMSAIREIRSSVRLAIVEAGVILSDLHEAVAAQGLCFPMTFGARGSARIGGMLATNAGGSNVLRYGNTRDLVLGVEAVLADGRIVNLMSELHKNNTGYDLRHLLIGSEGTLGVITGAVLKLVQEPRAHATAMVAANSLNQALDLLNRLQDASGSAVEAFEYMPARFMRAHRDRYPKAMEPFSTIHEVNILVELASPTPRDATPGPDGSLPLQDLLEGILGEMLGEGIILDAVLAKNASQRADMWARREAAAELSLAHKLLINNDIAVPLDKVAEFLERADTRIRALDPGFDTMVVSHLGDGNIHYALWPTPQMDRDTLIETIEEILLDLGGSFSAEHGIGTAKLNSMSRRKDPVALDMMRAIKAALDPHDILNPGKLIPASSPEASHD